jgi:hypothetical protein
MTGQEFRARSHRFSAPVNTHAAPRVNNSMRTDGLIATIGVVDSPCGGMVSCRQSRACDTDRRSSLPCS